MILKSDEDGNLELMWFIEKQNVRRIELFEAKL